MREMPKPVIAAVNGVAAGAGCNLALAADIALASRAARFIQVFVRIGLVPDAGGTWTVPRLIGRARALRWMMTGDEIDAETAERWGLITEICEPDSLMARAEALASRLARAPTRTLARIKRLVDASSRNDLRSQLVLERDAQTQAGRDRDFVEGVTAFAEKRKPQFRGA